MMMRTRLATALLALSSQLALTLCFQNGGIHSSSRTAPQRLPSLAFARPQTAHHYRTQTPLQAAFISEITEIYSYGMAKYYLATQSVTGGVLCGVGDAVAQCKDRFFQDNSKKFDFTLQDSIDTDRVLRFAVKGLVGGIIWSQWYGLADEWSFKLANDFLTTIGGSDDIVWSNGIHRAVQTVTAILLEQFVACPIVYSLWDIPFPMLASGAPVESVPAQVKNKIGPLLMENAKVWSFVNIIIYNIPVEFRLLAMSTADIFWQSVVAGVAAEAAADADGDKNDATQSNKSEGKTVKRLTE